MMKLIKFLMVLIVTIAGASAIIIFYPQTYCCTNKVTVSNFNIYFCGSENTPNPNAIAKVVAKTESLIKKSAIYNPDVKFNIFVPGRNMQCAGLPLQFKPDVAAQTIAFTNNTFVTHADFDNNRSNNFRYSRRLAELLAHEATHVMYEKKFGWFKTRPATWFNQNSNTDLGLFWKEEGYAEYVAGDLSVRSQINYLNNKYSDGYGRDYAKSWIAMKYLLDVKKMSLEQILDTDLDLDEVVQKAKRSF